MTHELERKLERSNYIYVKTIEKCTDKPTD